MHFNMLLRLLDSKRLKCAACFKFAASSKCSLPVLLSPPPTRYGCLTPSRSVSGKSFMRFVIHEQRAQILIIYFALSSESQTELDLKLQRGWGGGRGVRLVGYNYIHGSVRATVTAAQDVRKPNRRRRKLNLLQKKWEKAGERERERSLRRKPSGTPCIASTPYLSLSPLGNVCACLMSREMSASDCFLLPSFCANGNVCAVISGSWPAPLAPSLADCCLWPFAWPLPAHIHTHSQSRISTCLHTVEAT